MGITEGSRVEVLNARGERTERVALSGVVAGRDFPVVWVCFPQEIEDAEAEGREPVGVPWPAEDVTELEPALSV
jgi:hypothetical protein